MEVVRALPVRPSTSTASASTLGPMRALEQWSRQVERAARVQLVQLREQRIELNAAMSGRERLEPAQCLLELPLGPDLASAPRLVPRDRHMNETLKEVAFLGGRRAPCILELLVRGEVLAGPNQLDSSPIRGLELVRLAPRPTLPRA
jgi:hypothetical protein